MLDARSRNNQDCETTHCCVGLYRIFRARRYYMKMHLQPWLYAVIFFLTISNQSFGEDWVMFGRTPAHASFNSTENTLNKSVLSNLQPVWTQSFGTGFAASPTVVNGVLYFGGWNGYFYAVNGADGRVLW